jgi:hypothetical protein
LNNPSHFDIFAGMELRKHPLIAYRGLPSWPPTWSPANPARARGEILKGEIGRLKHVLPNISSDRCFLLIEHEGEGYIGCLFFEDAIFCTRLSVL